jgi:hypothetical protein
MKRLSVFVALALVLCFGLAYADRSVSLDEVTNTFGSPDTISVDKLVEFRIRMTNTGAPPGEDTDLNYNFNNGFRLFSDDGAEWSYPVRDTTIDTVVPPPTLLTNTTIDSTVYAPGVAPFFGVTLNRVYFSVDGAGGDTLGFAGATSIPSLGVRPGDDKVFYWIPVNFDSAASDGAHICIDSSWFPPGGTWKWAPLQLGNTQIAPLWSGQQCWPLGVLPDAPPEFDECPGAYEFSHCGVGTFNTHAFDPDQTGNIQYSLESGPGSVDPNTGTWTWSGPSVPQSGFVTVDVGATDVGGSGQTTICTVEVTVTNSGPSFATGCGAAKTIQAGTEGCFAFTADDDCDDLSYYVVDDGGLPGTMGFVDNVLCVTPDPPAAEYTITVGVTDGEFNDEQCQVRVSVIEGAPYVVRIEKDEGEDGKGAIQGQFTDVDIILEKIQSDSGYGLGGFNLLIAYDNSALSFQKAVEGAIYDSCGWEYFDYRFGADGNCGGGCPSGLLRVVGIAETNNGADHPGCMDIPYNYYEPISLATLRFLVSSDFTLNCQYAPIRFFWVDCGDNTLSSADGNRLFISSKVFDFDQEDPLTPVDYFPNYTGAIAECLEGAKLVPERAIDFLNGGVDIICKDSIDAPGDINVNAIAYEIADAVMFTNYFVQGLGAFQGHPEASIAASDVNLDGIALTVADLVYLIRVVVGDAAPYPKTNPEAMTYSVDNGVISVDGEVGAAFIVASGEFEPRLLADNMEMKFSHVDGNTRILVYGFDAGDAFTGDFLQIQGDVLTLEMATYAGAPIASENVPTDFALEQNYPNPFNPTTTVAFNLPTRSDWKVTFYNVTGQVVDVVSGTDPAGTVSFEWDASNYASGIYFYTLEAKNYKETRKAILLK